MKELFRKVLFKTKLSSEKISLFCKPASGPHILHGEIQNENLLPLRLTDGELSFPGAHRQENPLMERLNRSRRHGLRPRLSGGALPLLGHRAAPRHLGPDSLKKFLLEIWLENG